LVDNLIFGLNVVLGVYNSRGKAAEAWSCPLTYA